MNTVALYIGWAVLGAVFLVGVSAIWWGLGELVWRAIPEGWRAAQKFEVPQRGPRDYIPPGVSRKALALMLVLGGPYGWLRFPSLIKHNRWKRSLLDDEQQRGEGG